MRLSAQELHADTEVDFDEVVALVATIPSGESETIIGGGRYLVIDRNTTSRQAEIAFMIQRNYQGLGIAGRILSSLARIARAKGVEEFEAEVLPHNHAMLAVFARSGLPMKRTQEEGVVCINLTL